MAGDGQRAAYHMLHMGEVQACPNPAGFVDAMVDLFKLIANIHAPRGIDLDQVKLASLTLVADVAGHCGAVTHAVHIQSRWMVGKTVGSYIMSASGWICLQACL